MGKGGTRFLGDAIAQRTSKRKQPTGKELRKEMERFLETGEHPEVKQREQSEVLQPLPVRDPARAHVFMEFKAGGEVLGRLVYELFEDEVPLAAAEFKRRCSSGAAGSFQGTTVHKLLRDFGVYGGRSDRYNSGGQRLRPSNRVRHLERGLVSISLDGTEFVLPMARALHLDESYQVVGRVVHSAALLDVLNSLPTRTDDSPATRLTVSRVGAANGRDPGADPGEPGGSARPETAEEAAAKVEAQAGQAREAVRDALTAALSAKRKAPEGPGPSAAASKKKVLDAFLGGEDSDESSEEGGG